MNCKQGDLAIIIKSWARNEGKIVTCIKYHPNIIYRRGIRYDVWEIDRHLPGENNSRTRYFLDLQLRALRGLTKQEGADEAKEKDFDLTSLLVE